MSLVRTLRSGDTPDGRTVLSSSVAPTPAPTIADSGFHLQGADFLHAYSDLGGSGSARIVPWYFSSIAQGWFEGDPIDFTPAIGFALVEVRGEERVFFRMNTKGGSGTVRIWAGYSFENRGPGGE